MRKRTGIRITGVLKKGNANNPRFFDLEKSLHHSLTPPIATPEIINRDMNA
jgi:hypothetical protein